MILSSLLTLLKSNLSYLELFIKHFITAIETIEIYLCFIWIQPHRIFFFSRRVLAKHHTISSRCRILAGLDSAKFGFYRFQRFLFIVVIVTSILLKNAFWQTSIHNQFLVKILLRSDKDIITFNAIEKHRYGLPKIVSKHLNTC